MKKTALQLTVVLVLAFIWEVATTVYILALQSKATGLVFGLAFTLPFVSFVGQLFFVENKKFWFRIALTVASGVGYAFGAMVSLAIWR